MNAPADTMKFRREAKKRGQYGTDWHKYYAGVPPEDDDNDYEWTGPQWAKVWEEAYHD